MESTDNKVVVVCSFWSTKSYLVNQTFAKACAVLTSSEVNICTRKNFPLAEMERCVCLSLWVENNPFK